jgi:spermidine/putrescine transport system substrate-binding protein
VEPKLKKVFHFCIFLVLFVGVLTGCKGEDNVLNIYSWSDNIDPEVIKDFEEKYDVKVNYDVYSSNEELLAKLQAGEGQYDIIQPSDYMVETMIKLNLLEKLNKENIPNLKNIVSNFQTPPFDPDNQYSIVYTWGVTGIAYNKKYVKDNIDSWDDLWNDQYKGRLVLLNDSREVIGMALKKNGFSNSTKDLKQLETAVADLKKLVPNVLAFDTETIKQKFIAEEAWIGTVWSGDAAYIYEDNPNIEFVVPKEGATIWADTIAIPKGAKHKELAEKFINYLLEPEVSVKNYEAIGYSNPNEKAYPLHSEKYRANKMIFLSKEELDRTEWLVDVGERLKDYDRFWTELKSGSK